jgi:pimeloyl-ACP methyl ester carboxylesterase
VTSQRQIRNARSGTTLGLFRDHETDWLFKRTLEYASVGCAEVGECLVAAREVDPRDAETWIRAWSALAARVESLGAASLKAGRSVSARGCFLRAMNYWRTAEYACAPDHLRFHDLWRSSVACMARALPLLDGAAERVEIPFDGMILPGYLWRPDRSAAKRPTLVFVGGHDSSGEEMLMVAGRAAVERGYTYLTFEYPGHRGAVHLDPRCVRRPDMEAPFAAAFDWLQRLPCVDERIALAGFSFGGHVVTRVAAFEPRVRFLIPDTPLLAPGEIFSRSRSTPLARLPDALFDAVVAHRLRGSGILKNFFRYGGWVMGRDHSSYARIARIDYSAYDVRPHLGRITCPVLALAGAGEGEAMQRQAREFMEKVGSRDKTLHVFTLERDGSDDHCQLDNISRGMQVAFDWLDERMG